MSEDPADSTHACPSCGERIKQVARKCRHCGDFLDPKLKKDRRKARRRELADSKEPGRLRKIWRVLCAVIFPILCFGLSEAGITKELLPDWNDGSLWVWGKLLYAAEFQRWSYPLLLWAMGAYVSHMLGHRNRWIEAGLMGGVILSSAYSLLFLPIIHLSLIAILIYGVGLLGFMPFAACVVYSAAYVRYRREAPTPETAVAGAGDEVAEADTGEAGEAQEEDDEGKPLPLPMPLAPVATAAEPLAWVPRAVWAAIGLGTGGAAFNTLVDLYSALPTSPFPSCYLATLAAQGDERLVRATPVRFSDGRLRPVSRQLRVFKAAELTLLAAAPALHAPLRWLYDRSGRPLAARMGKRQATIVYLLLVPAWLCAELCLRLLFRGSSALIDATYAEGLWSPGSPARLKAFSTLGRVKKNRMHAG